MTTGVASRVDAGAGGRVGAGRPRAASNRDEAAAALR